MKKPILLAVLGLIGLLLTAANPAPAYRDLALNPDDVHEAGCGYPHATSNSETRNEPCYWAINALKGYRNNLHHGPQYPSWGPEQRTDLWWKVDFGRSVEVDKETHKIMRVTSIADDIPPGFPIRHVESTLDYDYVELSGRPFLLPLKGNVIATGADFLEKNENEFRIYRKYEAESTISFGDADAPPVPDDKTKETVDPGQAPAKKP